MTTTPNYVIEYLVRWIRHDDVMFDWIFQSYDNAVKFLVSVEDKDLPCRFMYRWVPEDGSPPPAAFANWQDYDSSPHFDVVVESRAEVPFD